MSNRISKCILAASLAAATSVAVADDELIVYVTQDGAAFRDATVILDGIAEENVPRSGIVKFDLDGGSHTVKVMDVFRKVHEFRIDSVDGQLVDAAVAINAGKPKHFVEAFSRVESAADRRNAPKGTLAGKINLTGADVTGATVTVEKTGDSVTVDASGEYEFTLPRGEYDLVINHPEASKPQTFTTRIVSNITRGKNFYLSSAASAAAAPAIANPLDAIPEGLLGDVEEVLVTATFNPNAFGETEQFSSSVVNTLSFEDLARFSAGDVAAAVVKAPGVTVQDGKYLFIRGLGGRYITATLNGATLPSTDPNKRTVPLDLFPTNMVDQLDIKKTFVTSMPGESTGGNLIINTRSFPDERAGTLSLKVGGNSWVTDHQVRVDPTEGAYDFIGWDDGSREEPFVVRALSMVLDPNEGYTDYLSDNAELQVRRAAGALLLDDLDFDRATATPDVSIGANAGDLFYLGDNELGVFTAVNYSNSWSRQDRAIRNTFSRQGEEQDKFSRDRVSNNIESSGLLSLGLNVGDSTFESVTILSRSTNSWVDYREGFNFDAGFDSVDWTIQWEERQFVAQQLLGEHVLGGLLAKWQVTGSQSTRLAPDRREIRFDQRDTNNDIGAFTFESGELVRRYDDLVDNNIDASFDFEYEADITGSIVAKFEAGAKAIRQERDVESKTYGFNPVGFILGGRRDNVALSTNLLAEEVLNHQTNGVSPGFLFADKTPKSNSYDSELELDAVYASIDSTIANNFQVVLGARHEEFYLETNTFNLTNGNPDQSVIDESILLPSLSFNWMFSESMQFRMAASKTASRPDFKEKSNATWFDEENNRYRGNPFLGTSEVLNLDARFEWYFGDDDEKLTIARFYKDIENAIEEVRQLVSGTVPETITFENADNANIEGTEVDFKKNFGLLGFSNQTTFVQANFAVIDSLAQIENQDDRTLQGQPEYTANLILGWDDLARDQRMTLLINRNGDSIRFVGQSGQPNEVALGRVLLDLNYSKNFENGLTIGAAATNILDQDVRVIQSFSVEDPFNSEQINNFERTTRRYRTGVGFEASIKWNF